MHLKKLWNKVLAVGVTDELTVQSRKRVVILNSIAVVVSAIYLVYVIAGICLRAWEILPFKVFGFALFSFPLLLNKQHFYHGARWFFCLGIIAFFTVCSISFGEKSGMHYALPMIGIVPLFFLSNVHLSPFYLFSP